MESFEHLFRTIVAVFLDILTFTRLCLRPTTAVVAENLFLRKQLGLFVERKVKPHRATDSVRFTLARLSRWFDGGMPWAPFVESSTRSVLRFVEPRAQIARIDTIPVMDDVSISFIACNALANLLKCPFRGRMRCDVEV